MSANIGKLLGITALSFAAIVAIGYFMTDREQNIEDTRDCIECPDGFYFDESACMCFAAGMCKIGCPEGQTNDPRYTCQCTDRDEVEALYQYFWGDECPIFRCLYEHTPSGPTEDYECDAEGNKICKVEKSCGDEDEEWPRYYWDERTCMCMVSAYCEIGCPFGQTNDPRYDCECSDWTEVNSLSLC